MSQQPRKSPSVRGLRSRARILVTGGAGFIGSNLASRLASEGFDVLVLDALLRPGVERNMRWLKSRHPERITPITADIRDASTADVIRDADSIFHFAAQVAVTDSLKRPLDDFAINLRGSMDLLEAARRSPRKPAFIFASTNKVYGDLADIELEATGEAYAPRHQDTKTFGISEQRSLSFHTPYGCSKGAADQYVLDYARSFGLRATVLRMSCIYGPRQFGTEDQGWVAHFVLSALAGSPITVYGDGRQVRDILYVDDAVEAYVRALDGIDRVAGHALNLGGGPENAVSLRQVIAHIARLLGRMPDIRSAPWRPGDQRYYVSDTRKIAGMLELPRPRHFESGLALLTRWLKQSRQPTRQRVPAAASSQAHP